MSDTEKYIPKVGEEFEWQTLGGWNRETEVVFETKKEIAVINRQGFIDVISKDIDFRPIPVKADVEREQLYSFFNNANNFSHSDEWVIKRIQQAGFTIPKKVKRSDVAKTINHASCYANSRIDERMCNAICTLFGDLVEQDQ